MYSFPIPDGTYTIHWDPADPGSDRTVFQFTPLVTDGQSKDIEELCKIWNLN